MRCFRDYADEAAKFASPYIKRTGAFFSDAGDSVKDWYGTKKKEYMRRRNPTLWDKLCAAVGGSIKLIMIIAGVIGAIAGGIVAARMIIKKLYCSNHKIVSYDGSAAEEDTSGSESPEAEESEDTSSEVTESTDEEASDDQTDDEPSDEIKKEKGYIVL